MECRAATKLYRVARAGRVACGLFNAAQALDFRRPLVLARGRRLRRVPTESSRSSDRPRDACPLIAKEHRLHRQNQF